MINNTAYQSSENDLLSIIQRKMENGNTLPNIKTKIFKKNQTIYHGQEKINSIYVIRNGRVKIGTHQDGPREMIKSVLQKGDFFGNLSLIGQEQGGNFAIAMEDTTVFVFGQEELSLLIKEDPQLILILLNTLGRRLIDMERRLESLVFRNSRSRIIDFLENQVLKRGQRVGYEMLVRNFFTHQEIANLTATSRQTVTTVLNELRSKNILILNRHRMLIRDMDLLTGEAA